jgi:hypothetical protein
MRITQTRIENEMNSPDSTYEVILRVSGVGDFTQAYELNARLIAQVTGAISSDPMFDALTSGKEELAIRFEELRLKPPQIITNPRVTGEVTKPAEKVLVDVGTEPLTLTEDTPLAPAKRSRTAKPKAGAQVVMLVPVLEPTPEPEEAEEVEEESAESDDGDDGDDGDDDADDADEEEAGDSAAETIPAELILTTTTLRAITKWMYDTGSTDVASMLARCEKVATFIPKLQQLGTDGLTERLERFVLTYKST